MNAIAFKHSNLVDYSKRIKVNCSKKTEHRTFKGLNEFRRTLDKSTKQFVAANITLQYKKPCGTPNNTADSHTNVLLADKITKEVERFDPMGWSSGRYGTDILDAAIEQILPPGYRMIKTYEFCPRVSIQGRQSRQKINNEGDPGGFCFSWSVWWVEYRIINSDISRDQLLAYALKNIPDLTSFIRNYASELTSLMFDYMQKVGCFQTDRFVSKSIVPEKSLGYISIDNEWIPAVIKLKESTNEIEILTLPKEITVESLGYTMVVGEVIASVRDEYTKQMPSEIITYARDSFPDNIFKIPDESCLKI